MNFFTKYVQNFFYLMFIFFQCPNVFAGNNAGASFGVWPDTGQDKCYNETSEITCPTQGDLFYGQDAQSLVISRSYTKFDKNMIRAKENKPWIIVKDNVTGLIWEVKTDDGSIHDRSNKYLWCDSIAETNGGNEGVCGYGESTKYFIDELNSASFGGYSDWRLPTVKELLSLLYYHSSNQKIVSEYFPYLGEGSVWDINYWSATTSVNDNDEAYSINFRYEEINSQIKSIENPIRAVRGGSSMPASHFIDNLDGTVTDTNTGLMWQKNAADWWGDEEPDTMTWKWAFTYCDQLELAGYDDWRLPSINELLSVAEFSDSKAFIDKTIFPNNESSFWTSTTRLHGTINFDVVDANTFHFSYGYLDSSKKGYQTYTKAVRAGKTSLLINLEGNGQGVINSNIEGINCGLDCYQIYNRDQSLTLTATPNEGSTFMGWSGDDCFGLGECTVTLNQAKIVNAKFESPTSWRILLPAVLSVNGLPKEKKTVFISSKSYNGNLGGLIGADKKCNSLAQTANLTGTYKAWLADNYQSPSTRFSKSPTIVYTLIDGMIVANNWGDLIDGTIDHVINLDEMGRLVSGNAWTSTKENGTAMENFQGKFHSCVNWTTSLYLPYGETPFGSSGRPTAHTDNRWSDYGLYASCNVEYRILCFEQ